MSLRIIRAGICDTIQDGGRHGHQHLGINPGGVMDHQAMQLANGLVGNRDDAAVLEMHFPAATIMFESPCLIALAGADFAAELGGVAIPVLQPVLVAAGSTLQFRQRRKGSWCYLAVYGGFAADDWMGSQGTMMSLGRGGHQGRKLQKGDHIAFGPSSAKFTQENNTPLPWFARPCYDPFAADEIAVVEGPEFDMLDEPSRLAFREHSFSMLPASDRMAYAVQGPALSRNNNEQLVSSAVSFGTLQLLPDGRLLALMADHQTTGGYPRIAQVVQAHHSRLAQLRPGDAIRWRMINLMRAQQLWLQQFQHAQILAYAAADRLKSLNLIP